MKSLVCTAALVAVVRASLVWAALPEQITALESEQRDLTARMCRPDYFREGAERMRTDRARAAEIETQLSARLERWELLERLQAGGAE